MDKNELSAVEKRTEPIRLASEADFDLGKFHVRPSTREILFGDQRMVLEPRVAQVLTLLTAARDRIVSREELIERCWSGRIVSENALNRVISQIRKLSMLDSQASFRLETIARVGYGLRASGPDAEIKPANLPETRLRDRIFSRRNIWLGAALVAAGAATWLLIHPKERLRIAVLPFDTPDESTKPLADALATELLNSLLTISGIDVIARSSTFEMRKERKATAAKALNATYLLDGTLSNADNTIKISVYLVDARRKVTIWSQQYDGASDELRNIQKRIVRDATAVLRLGIANSGDEASIDPSAYRRFLQGLGYLNSDAPASNDAVAAFEDTVKLAPKFSRGWSMLSAAYIDAQGPIDQAIYTPIERAKAREAAEKAMVLDGHNVQAYACLASATDRAGNWAKIEDLHLKALQLEPSNIDAVYGAGTFYADVGFASKSIDLLRRAQSLDPLNPFSTFVLLRVLEAVDRDAEVNEILQSANAQWPNNRSLWRFSMRHAIWKRRHSEALALARRAPTGAEQDARYFLDLIACQQDPRSPRLQTFLAPAQGGPLPYTWPIFIFALAMLNQADPCVTLIKRVYLSDAGRQKAPTWALQQAMLRPIWHHKGLEDVFVQLGLTSYWATRSWRPISA